MSPEIKKEIKVQVLAAVALYLSFVAILFIFTPLSLGACARLAAGAAVAVELLDAYTFFTRTRTIKALRKE